MSANVAYSPSRSLPAKIRRRLVQWRTAEPALSAPSRPLVSFTFDDFPKSALNGVDIVEDLGGRATLYACTGFMGARDPEMGEMFDADTLNELHKRGHEIGAHTHTHSDCARMSVDAFHKDVGENLVQLLKAGFPVPPQSFAFPFGETSFATKKAAGHIFGTSRSVLAGLNHGRVDRAQLRAVELDASDAGRKRAVAALKNAIKSKSWLVFFTHDVSKTPSRFGVPPELITELARMAFDEGAKLANVQDAACLAGVTPPDLPDELAPDRPAVSQMAS